MQVIDETTELLGDFAAYNMIGLFGAVNHVVLQRNSKWVKNFNTNTLYEPNEHHPSLYFTQLEL